MDNVRDFGTVGDAGGAVYSPAEVSRAPGKNNTRGIGTAAAWSKAESLVARGRSGNGNVHRSVGFSGDGSGL